VGLKVRTKCHYLWFGVNIMVIQKLTLNMLPLFLVVEIGEFVTNGGILNAYGIKYSDLKQS
jgi:hypothetical protein